MYQLYTEYKHLCCYVYEIEFILYTVYLLSSIKWSVHCHNSMSTAPVNSAAWLAADRIHALAVSFTITSSYKLWPVNGCCKMLHNQLNCIPSKVNCFWHFNISFKNLISWPSILADTVLLYLVHYGRSNYEFMHKFNVCIVISITTIIISCIYLCISFLHIPNSIAIT